jgi:signal transduction histidine kinase/CheY-like chemotaxis protein/CHASE3 domain sensor protein
MADSTSRSASKRPGIDASPLVGLAVVVFFFLASGYVAYQNIDTLSRNTKLVTHTHDVLIALENIHSLLKDAETGQRGYLLTGDEEYLEPYSSAVNQVGRRIDELEDLISDNRTQRVRIPDLKMHVADKRKELEETISLRREKGFEPAMEVVSTNQGKRTMDAIRSDIESMAQEERRLRAERLKESQDAFQNAILGSILSAIFGIFLSLGIAYLLRRASLMRQRQAFLTSGQSGLSVAVLGDKQTTELGESVLKFLAEYLDAHAGALFLREGNGYRRVAAYGIHEGDGTPQFVGFDDGLIGQAAKDRRTVLMRDVPEGYLTVSSGLGHGRPRHLAISPVTADGVANAVLELGFIHPLDEATTDLLDRVSEPIGIALRSANYRSHLKNLLDETQRQSEELQTQSEELRVSNEELEEQGRVLKESQARLEIQQTELEEANAQMEEQTSLLEAERDGLARVQAALQLKSRDLERASQYKSEFLANMSHELRTPLNSSLILAKLLADNPQGNLSEEQVQFAETIRSAGNDLLTLINDILDLSKIEAGHMEIRADEFRITDLIENLGRTFSPVASDKGLSYSSSIMPGSPETINSDRQRLEQVLKNLLSNALKFTESGEVKITVSPSANSSIAFAVSDTGIGIPTDQQQLVFEAFRQVDGTSDRKFGGTGLGLSISRQLTQLLGGQLSLASEPGRGSTFTVTIPVTFDAAVGRPTEQRSVEPKLPHHPAGVIPRNRPEKLPRTLRIKDDREVVGASSRVILIVEDDPAFARILSDLVHELQFQSLVATTAEEGTALAVQHLPSAIVLDIGLPDHSGLAVLDRLKHDARTRHIPVHVVSAGDYAETALALGAVGYTLKPVKREELSDALKGLETKFERRMRRILIVEDDPVQLDGLRRLLASNEVETVGAASASECLERLQGATYDCMVLDLTLPDASGYSLLETLSREDSYSFPPVIVYTGRDLSTGEEQRLRRFSKSIIIKGAKSPERLLDEVTLFLHQVVSELPPEQQRMLEKAKSRDAALEGRRILVVEDDVRNVFALTSILEPKGATVEIARNGREAIDALTTAFREGDRSIDLVLMDVMMPEMDGLAATREIRMRAEWKKLPIIMLTAKAMPDDQENCLAAGANDYMAKPLDVEKLLSLVRVWMPR